ncbi:MAG: NAD(P)/FAD-dependent oxidoreductase [Halocynthiibacter sp.]
MNVSPPHAVIIGAGPAGLMAAYDLARAGVKVTLTDAMPTIGRKFLMAGKSGLNLTKSEDLPAFIARFPDCRAPLKAALKTFGPAEVTAFSHSLGQETFEGSTHRVFPKAMKASPFLRAWVSALTSMGVDVKTRWHWDQNVTLTPRFSTPEGPKTLTADVVILALGGASWPKLGSTGAWRDAFLTQGIQVTDFKPSNCGFAVPWSKFMAPFFGHPIKNVTLTSGNLTSHGECVITEKGLEGGGIYEVSAAIRNTGKLTLSLCPDMDRATLEGHISRSPKKASTATLLKRIKTLTPAKIALFHEFARPTPKREALAERLTALEITGLTPLPIAEAISVAGGVSFEALDDQLMIQSHEGVFCAGEMLDWDAPTGGYLLTACFATGRHAAQGALQLLRDKARL